MRGVPHITGSLGSCAELDYVAFSEGPEIAANIRGISGSNARRKLGGAKRGRCRVALFETSPPAGPESVQATHKSRSQQWKRKRRGTFFWQTASWWLSTRISACRAARVRNWRLLKRKGDEKRAHRCSHHDLANSRNPCVFRSDGVFGSTRTQILRYWSRILQEVHLSANVGVFLPCV